MDVAAPQKRKVNWGMVILGLVIAWVSGAFIAFLAAIGGLTLFEKQAVLAFIGPMVAVALFYGLMWWVTRRPAPDFAIGLLIGGCMMALVAGGCGALMSGMSNMH
jgi:hypothetical protein